MREKKMARLIDADALYDKLTERYQRSSGWAHKAFGTAIDDVTDAPTIEADPVVHGRWETDCDPEECVKDFYCSVCEELLCDFDTTALYPGENCYYYCPNCGAKMDGESA